MTTSTGPTLSMGRRAARGEDAAIWFERDGALIMVLTDGATGTPGGAIAAQRVAPAIMRYVREHALDLSDPVTWVMLLAQIDTDLCDDPEAGECGACVVALQGGQLVGASVGDACALLVGDVGSQPLTSRQHPRPRIGDGGARPVAFGPVEAFGRLLLMSDGALHVASIHEIAGVARRARPQHVAEAVAALAGDTPQDDVTVLCAVFEA